MVKAGGWLSLPRGAEPFADEGDKGLGPPLPRITAKAGPPALRRLKNARQKTNLGPVLKGQVKSLPCCSRLRGWLWNLRGVGHNYPLAVTIFDEVVDSATNKGPQVLARWNRYIRKSDFRP